MKICSKLRLICILKSFWSDPYQCNAEPSDWASGVATWEIRETYCCSTSRLANTSSDGSLRPVRTIDCDPDPDELSSSKPSVRASRFSVVDGRDWASSTIAADVSRIDPSKAMLSVDSLDRPTAEEIEDGEGLRETEREDSTRYSTIAIGSNEGIREGLAGFDYDPSPVRWRISNEYSCPPAVRFDSTTVEDWSRSQEGWPVRESNHYQSNRENGERSIAGEEHRHGWIGCVEHVILPMNARRVQSTRREKHLLACFSRDRVFSSEEIHGSSRRSALESDWDLCSPRGSLPDSNRTRAVVETVSKGSNSDWTRSASADSWSDRSIENDSSLDSIAANELAD